MKKYSVALILAACLGASAAHAGPGSISACNAAVGNIVTNCGFETGDLTGWSSNGGNNVGTGASNANSGNYGISYGGVGRTFPLSQTLSTVSGTTYDISFWLDSNGSFTNEVSLSWGGATIFDQADIPYSGWSQYSFTEVATSSSTILQFGLRQDPGWSGLDDVVVIATAAAAGQVPEPASMALLGLGLAGLMRSRRKAKQA